MPAPALCGALLVRERASIMHPPPGKKRRGLRPSANERENTSARPGRTPGGLCRVVEEESGNAQPPPKPPQPLPPPPRAFSFACGKPPHTNANARKVEWNGGIRGRGRGGLRHPAKSTPGTQPRCGRCLPALLVCASRLNYQTYTEFT